MKAHTFRIAPIILVYSCLASACTTAAITPYTAKVDAFSHASTTLATEAADYYNDLNAYERRAYISSLRADPQADLNLARLLAADPFSAESIQTRIALLNSMTAYSSVLVAIASSDAPETWGQSVTEFSDSLTELATTADRINEDDRVSSGLKSVSGPAGELLAMWGNASLEQQRSDALDQVILDSSAAMTQVVSVLRDDLEVFYDQRETGYWDTELEAIKIEYETAQRALDTAEDPLVAERQRQAVLDRLTTVSDRLSQDLSGVASLERAVNAYDRARAALERYARSDRTPADLAQLSSAVDLFVESTNLLRAITEDEP